MDIVVILIAAALLCLFQENSTELPTAVVNQEVDDREIKGNRKLNHREDAFMEVAKRLGFDCYGNTTSNTDDSRRF